ncbi:unnamed protein product, partial [Pylaiella littoralis]
SREEWISKLDDARCNWMVMLQRYSSSRSDISNNPLGKLRQSDARKTSVNNGRVPGLRVVAAADFCPECASIMKVELECTEEGEFVAEYREICSMCGNQQQTWRGSTTPNPWRIQDLSCNRQHLSHVSFSRGPRYAPSEESIDRHGADSCEAASRYQTNRPVEGRSVRRGDGEGLREARRERMLRRLTPSMTHPSRGSALRNRSTDKQGSIDGSGPAGGDPAACDPASCSAAANLGNANSGAANLAPCDPTTVNPATETSANVDPTSDWGKFSTRKEGSLPADGDWSEELRVKDELISTLKRQLEALGEQPMEEVVTLEEAKKRLREAIDALMAGNASTKMEQALEKWDKYVTNHPDHLKELAAEEQAWVMENEPKNNEALHLMKTFVPPNIFHAGLDGLRGGGLPPALAKRIFDRKVLWLIRAPDGVVSKTHVVELKSKFVANDLDIVESRALHACLPSTFENDADGAKTAWRVGFRKRLKELLSKEAKGQLKPAEVRRPVYKDLIQGPFDPDQPAEEQETMRSGAFDASEKPVVGGKLSSSKIAVIGEVLAAKLKSASPLLEVVADSSKGPDEVHTNRSAPNSPASKYRRQSYAVSRGQPTAVSMKNMMSELGSRLSSRRQDNRRRSSFNGSLDIPQLLRGALDPVSPPFSEPATKDEGTILPTVNDLFSESTSSEESHSEAATEISVGSANPVPTPQLAPARFAAPPIVKESKVLTTKKNDGASPSMKQMFAELAAKAQVRKEQSSGPAKQEECQGNMLPPPSPPPPPPPPRQQQQQQETQKKGANDTANKSTGDKTKPVSMKEMMAELEMKAKARAERYAA